MTDTGAAFRLEARSANGLSSSMNGETRNGDTDPKPADDEEKSPRGGDDIAHSALTTGWLLRWGTTTNNYCVELWSDGGRLVPTRQFPQRQD